MDDSLDFTDDEIREELSKLGYTHVPDTKLVEFKKDLGRLIRHERSKQSSQNTSLSSHFPDTSHSVTGGSGHGSAVPRTRTPLEESPVERQTEHEAETRRQYSGIRIGKENRGLEPEVDPVRRGVSREPAYQDVRVPSQQNGHFSLYDSEANQSQLSHRDDVSETDSERRMVKRKVLRKEKDGTRRVDESMTESEAGSLMDINERLRELGIYDSVDFFNKKRPQSAQDAPPYRLSPDDPRPASVILRKSDHPHTKNLRKSDPVARYQEFRKSWEQQRAPGEKNHKNLRWNVREQMLAQDVVYEKKPQRVFVPNKYTVPSDKKRNALRWQIRMDMAQGELPHHGFYQEY